MNFTIITYNCNSISTIVLYKTLKIVQENLMFPSLDLRNVAIFFMSYFLSFI